MIHQEAATKFHGERVILGLKSDGRMGELVVSPLVGSVSVVGLLVVGLA